MCLVCLGHTELCFVKCGFPFWDWTLFSDFLWRSCWFPFTFLFCLHSMGMFSVDLAPAGHTLVSSVSVVCISHIYPCGIVLVFSVMHWFLCCHFLPSQGLFHVFLFFLDVLLDMLKLSACTKIWVMRHFFFSLVLGHMTLSLEMISNLHWVLDIVLELCLARCRHCNLECAELGLKKDFISFLSSFSTLTL